MAYDSVEQYVNNSFIVKKNNLYGLVNLQGKEIVPCKFESFYFRNDTRVIEAKMPDGTFSVYDENGKQLCNIGKHDSMFTDTPKKIIIAIIYGESYLESYEKIYDINGKIIFDNVESYWGADSGKYFTIRYKDDETMYIYDEQYKLIRTMSGYGSLGWIEDKYIYYTDKNAETTTIESFDGTFSAVIDGKYNSVELFNNKILLYNRLELEKVCCYDLTKKTVTYLPAADYIQRVSDNVYISVEYPREDGMAQIGKDITNIYDLNGNSVYSNVKDFNGYVEATDNNMYILSDDNNTWSLMDSTGKILINKSTKQILYRFDNYFKVDGSVVKSDGTVVISKEDFEQINSIDNEYFAGCVNGKWGFYKIGKAPAKVIAKVTKPAQVKIKSIKNIKSRKVKVTWKKVKNISGYKLMYATNKKFTKNKKTVNVKKTAKSKIIKK